MGSKSRSPGQIIEKDYEHSSEATFSAQSTSNLVRMMSLTKSWSVSKLGHVGSKSRSPVLIIEKAFEHSRGPINFKLGQNGDLDKILVELGRITCFDLNASFS